VYAGAGTYGLRDLRASATVGGGGFSLDAAGQKRDTDNHRENFRSQTDGAAVTGQWSNDWLRLGARIGRDSLDARLPGALTNAQYEADPRQSTTPTACSARPNWAIGNSPPTPASARRT
jgi:iron complex outermembrane receptor protein